MRGQKSGAPSQYESFELTLSDVYLLTKDETGDVAVPGLGVVINQSGLTVSKPDGSVAAVVDWADLKSLSTSERMEVEPGTPPAVVVEAVSSVRAHRFAVPTDDPEGLERVITELANLKTPREKQEKRPRFRWLRRDRNKAS
jgi:hypothetical protein